MVWESSASKAVEGLWERMPRHNQRPFRAYESESTDTMNQRLKLCTLFVARRGARTEISYGT